MKIADNVMEVLVKCTTKENMLFLPNVQLDRKLYVSVNKVLVAVGGKWNRGKKGHVFNNDPSDVLDEIINTGKYTDAKKEFQFFETPKDIVKRMIEFADIKPGDLLLEPSAGQGAILDEFPKGNNYIAVEILQDNIHVLNDKGYTVVVKDFLTLEVFPVDKVIMNPPFTRGQDVDHVLHAFEFLKPGGRLVSIVSESPFFRENTSSRVLRRFLDEKKAVVISLNHGAFKTSGTMVKTRIIVVDKP